MRADRILIALLLVLAFAGASSAYASSPKSDPKQASADNSSDALVLAVHLTRPEVIDTCLKEIGESKFEFVWTALETEESKDPINVIFKLRASLIDKASQTPTDKAATMTVSRDVQKLRAGTLSFDCRIAYETSKPSDATKR